MLYVDSDIVSSVFSDIVSEYVKMAKMTITQGKIHNYLRMTRHYSSWGKTRFSMVYYIENMLDKIPEDIKWES